MVNRNDSEIQKIKSHLDITYLKYISDNIKHLLNINLNNNTKNKENTNKEEYTVILYIRLSIEDGDIIDGDVSKSIKNQLLILLDECEKKHWIVVGIFCEEGISGIDDNRPEWKKALKFCEQGNTQIFLCKSQSRFSRSMEMIEKYLHNKFIEWNVRFVGLVDNTDTSIIGNKKARQINGLVNEWQVEDQSINIRAILKNKQSNGLFTGAFAPYGYCKDPKDKYHLVIDEEAANIIKSIFSMYASGKGVTKICQYLNENKIPIPSVYKYEKGLKYNNPLIECEKIVTYKVRTEDTMIKIANKYQSTIEDILKFNLMKNDRLEAGQIINIPVRYVWRTNTIYNILKNQVYIGTLIQHKNETISYKNKKERTIPKEERIIVPYCHKAIIDMKTWNIVNSKFERYKKNRPLKSGEISLFSHKIKCDCCNHSFYRDVKKNNKYIYWICGNRYKTAKLLCSNNKTIKEMELYNLIINAINMQISRYYDVDVIKKYYHKQKIAEVLENEVEILNKEKYTIEKNKIKSEKAIALLYEDRINGIIDLDEFLTIKKKNSEQIKRYKLRIEQIDRELEKLNNQKAERKNEEGIFSKYTQIEELDRNVLDEFIEQIYIGYYNPETKTRKIIIKWNTNESQD